MQEKQQRVLQTGISGRSLLQMTDALTTMEFSIAMLACRDWSNREIAEHIGVSLNTVKHYLTDIFNKLHVKKRDELKNFVLKWSGNPRR